MVGVPSAQGISNYNTPLFWQTFRLFWQTFLGGGSCLFWQTFLGGRQAPYDDLSVVDGQPADVVERSVDGPLPMTDGFARCDGIRPWRCPPYGEVLDQPFLARHFLRSPWTCHLRFLGPDPASRWQGTRPAVGERGLDRRVYLPFIETDGFRGCGELCLVPVPHRLRDFAVADEFPGDPSRPIPKGDVPRPLGCLSDLHGLAPYEPGHVRPPRFPPDGFTGPPPCRYLDGSWCGVGWSCG